MPDINKPFPPSNRLASLKNQVQLGAVLIAVASLVIVGSIIVLIGYNFQRTRLSHWLDEINQKSILQVESYLKDLIREVDHLGRIPGLTEMTRENQELILKGLVRLNKAYELVAILNREGELQTHVLDLGPIHYENYSDTRGFIYAFQRKSLYISTIVSRKDDSGNVKDILIVATPIRNKKDEVDGVAFVRINLKFFKTIVSQLTVGKTGQAFVLDERNMLVACSRQKAAEQIANTQQDSRFSDYPVLKLLYRNKEKTEQGSLQYKNMLNETVLGNVDFIRPVYWKMVIEIPVSEADALTYQMIQILVVALGIILIFTVLTSILFVNRTIISPLDKLISVSQKIIHGLLDTQVNIDSPREFKLLARTFNTMLMTLSHRIDFENLIINISNRFINFRPQNLNTLTTQSLQEIKNFFNTDYVFFYYFQGNKDHQQFYFAENGTNLLPKGSLFCSQCLNYPWYREQVRQSSPVILTRYEGISEKANPLQTVLKEHNILTLLHIPVTTREQTGGILGIHTLAREKNWDKHDLVLLKVLAEIFLNVFEQQKIKSELIESEIKYKELTDTLPHIIFEIDGANRLTFANQFALHLFGYSEEELKKGINLQDFFSAESWEQAAHTIQLILEGEKPLETEYVCKKKSGALFPVLMYPLPIWHNKTISGMRGIMFDLTERKKNEEEMAKMQKLESIGILSGGIAHDFNNILSSIIGNISLAKFSLQSQDYDDLEEILNDAQIAGLQARELTHQLLTFSKGGSPIKKLGSISQVVLETARFCLRGSNIEFELKTAPRLWNIEFDEGQICQVINNLLINAKQAMPEGGTILISIENAAEKLPAHFIPQSGRYLKITVRDSGTGIQESLIDKIFDPYFTTKQTGSGLGLTTVYSIIKQHHGFIDVTSTLNQGTCFMIYLPAIEHAVTAAQPSPDTECIIGKNKRILVMDDDLNIHKMIKSVLDSLGYEADLALEGAEAVEKYKQAFIDKKQYDVVILDLTVKKGMGGKEAIKQLRSFDQNIKAVVSSGYSNDPVMAEYKEYGFDAVLAKPYTLEDLGKVLASLV